jgi:hypothetical protein
VPAHGEFRCEVGADSVVSITLLEGDAEVFGAELVQGHPMSISDCKLGVYSWGGCKLMISNPAALCCAVLCCALLCCAVLCCAVLCCAFALFSSSSARQCFLSLSICP